MITKTSRTQKYQETSQAQQSIVRENYPYQKKGKRAYKLIEMWKRIDLIDSVTSKAETMKDCSIRLGINYWTAKHIIKVYRSTGSYETDLTRKKKQKDLELKQKVLNDSQFEEFTSKRFFGLQSTQLSKISNPANNVTVNQDRCISEVSNLNHTEANSGLSMRSDTSEDLQQVQDPNFLFRGIDLEMKLAMSLWLPRLQQTWKLLGNSIFEINSIN